jgi:hypothetical protein
VEVVKCASRRSKKVGCRSMLEVGEAEDDMRSVRMQENERLWMRWRWRWRW